MQLWNSTMKSEGRRRGGRGFTSFGLVLAYEKRKSTHSDQDHCLLYLVQDEPGSVKSSPWSYQVHYTYTVFCNTENFTVCK
uniref:Uncharacterized protein n=1 Tax=Anguilla anguilla TaxID=7936 RepID=A0A0E9WQL3_ANGAN